MEPTVDVETLEQGKEEAVEKVEANQAMDIPSSPISTTTTSTSSIMKEGSNIHNGSDGKKLCSYSKKLCQQRRMDKYGFCIKHILEDPTAPFIQCQFVSKQTKKLCTNPVPIKEESKYCAAHKQILGLIPRKTPQKKGKKNQETPNAEALKASSKKLAQILLKHGIHHEENDSDSSSSSFPSDSENEPSSSDSDDDFFSSTFTEEFEESDDFYLRDMHILTEEELIRRRRDKIKQLVILYRRQFRRLRDIMRNKHRRYLRQRQKLLESAQSLPNSKRDIVLTEKMKQKQKLLHQYQNYHPRGFPDQDLAKKKKASEIPEELTKVCSFEGCDSKSMPLTDFCYAHILNDPRQKLFSSCTFVSPEGISCNFPILIEQNPSLCNGHLDLQQMKETKQIRKRKITDTEEAEKKQKEKEKIVKKKIKREDLPKEKAVVSKEIKKPRKKKVVPSLPVNHETRKVEQPTSVPTNAMPFRVVPTTSTSLAQPNQSQNQNDAKQKI